LSTATATATTIIATPSPQLFLDLSILRILRSSAVAVGPASDPVADFIETSFAPVSGDHIMG
jgi:hypothetical protein